MFEWIEEIEFKGMKVNLHFLGFEGDFTVYARTERFTSIEKGKSIKEAKKKVLKQIDTFIK